MSPDSEAHEPLPVQPDENLYRLLARNLPNGSVFIFDRQMKYTFAEGPAITAAGFSPDHYIGKTLRDIFPPEVYERDEPVLKAALEGRSTTVEVDYGGRNYWVQTLPIRDADGTVKGGMVLTQDITDLQHSVALQREQQRFNDMVANIPAMLFRFRVVDGQLELDYLSPRCLELNGFHAEEALQNPQLLLDQIHPDDQQDFWERMLDATQRDRVFTWEGQVIVRGEPRWRKYEAYPTRDPDGNIVWNGLQTDTTDEKRTEKALLEAKRLETEYQKEQELSMLKTRMMQHISHEFRTPLSLILTATSMMDRYHKRISDEQRESYLGQITGQVERLTAFLDQIDRVMNGIFQTLDFTPREFDLVAVCWDIIQGLQSGGHTPPFEVTIADDLPPVVADEGQIQAMLSNLMSNAVKFSDSNSPIHLSVAFDERDVVIVVRDEGIGIPEDDMERLFEPFHRGTNVGEIPGLGLGLSTSYNAVELHGGTITVDSKVGQGTTITVRFPRKPETQEPTS